MFLSLSSFQWNTGGGGGRDTQNYYSLIPFKSFLKLQNLLICVSLFPLGREFSIKKKKLQPISEVTQACW